MIPPAVVSRDNATAEHQSRFAGYSAPGSWNNIVLGFAEHRRTR